MPFYFRDIHLFRFTLKVQVRNATVTKMFRTLIVALVVACVVAFRPSMRQTVR